MLVKSKILNLFKTEYMLYICIIRRSRDDLLNVYYGGEEKKEIDWTMEIRLKNLQPKSYVSLQNLRNKPKGQTENYPYYY